MSENSVVDLESMDLVLFDGVCNLCEASVQLIIKNDPEEKFSFAPLQSPMVKEFLHDSDVSPENLTSVIYVKKGQLFTKSSAALQICKGLSYPYKALSVLLIIPRPIRDFFYELIAQSRYRWFGKKEACMIPTPSLKKRFPLS